MKLDNKFSKLDNMRIKLFNGQTKLDNVPAKLDSINLNKSFGRTKACFAAKQTTCLLRRLRIRAFVRKKLRWFSH